jgi:hypothetical protein
MNVWQWIGLALVLWAICGFVLYRAEVKDWF